MSCLCSGLRLYFYFQSEIGYIVYPTKFIPHKSKETTPLVLLVFSQIKLFWFARA